MGYPSTEPMEPGFERPLDWPQMPQKLLALTNDLYRLP